MAVSASQAPQNQFHTGIEGLPEVALIHITNYLAPEDITRLALTCKRLYSVLPRFVVMIGKDFRIHGPLGGHWAPKPYFSGPPLPARVKQLTMSVEWKDQGWGNRKGQVFISLVRGRTKKIVAERREPMGIAPHDWATVTVELAEDNVVTEARQGDFYQFARNAGGGGGHKLEVKNFKAIAHLCKE